MIKPFKPSLPPIVSTLFLLWIGAASGAEPPAKPYDANVKLKHFTAFYRNAQVFRDANGNGTADAFETVYVTGEDGGFDAPNSDEPFVLIGGVNINTGRPNPYKNLSSPANAGGIGTLPAIWQSLLDRGVKNAKIKTTLRIPASFSLPKYSAASLKKPLNANQDFTARTEGKSDVLGQFVRTLATVTFGPQFLAQGAKGKRLEKLLLEAQDEAIGELAQTLLELGPKNWSDEAGVEEILSLTLYRLGISPTADELTVLATVASDINALVDQAPQNKLLELIQIVGEAADLLQVQDYATLWRDYTLDALQRRLGYRLSAPCKKPYTCSTRAY